MKISSNNSAENMTPFPVLENEGSGFKAQFADLLRPDDDDEDEDEEDEEENEQEGGRESNDANNPPLDEEIVHSPGYYPNGRHAKEITIQKVTEVLHDLISLHLMP